MCYVCVLHTHGNEMVQNFSFIYFILFVVVLAWFHCSRRYIHIFVVMSTTITDYLNVFVLFCQKVCLRACARVCVCVKWYNELLFLLDFLLLPLPVLYFLRLMLFRLRKSKYITLSYGEGKNRGAEKAGEGGAETTPG